MSLLELPGFRFHPTEQELIEYYLLNAVTGNSSCFHIIGFLNIYHYHPEQLPKLAMNGEREWYFLVPRERKVGGGGRPNRATGNGFWKATGSDRKIISSTGHKRVIGLKKTLVFYRGKAPQGKKTDWVMNEYRLPDNSPLLSKEVVLCKIYRKATSLKVMEQRAAMEESLNLVRSSAVFQSQVIDPVSMSFNLQDHKELVDQVNMDKNVFKMEEEEEDHNKVEDDVESERVAEEIGVFEREKLTELQVPNFNLDWTQDPVWSHQLNSPWLQNLITPNFPSIINLY